MTSPAASKKSPVIGIDSQGDTAVIADPAIRTGGRVLPLPVPIDGGVLDPLRFTLRSSK